MRKCWLPPLTDFDRDKAERARNKFIETQAEIDALDRAMNGERTQTAPLNR